LQQIEGRFASALEAGIAAESARLTQLFETRFLAVEQAHQAKLLEVERAHQAKVLELFEQIRLARRRMFGPSSEAHLSQALLFNEAEQLADASPDTAQTVELPATVAAQPADQTGSAPDKASPVVKKSRGKRAPLPAQLPRVDVVVALPESERLCACGTPMVEIGEDISEQLDIIPMQVRVLRTIRKRYACPDETTTPLTAPAPARILPKSNASNSLLAMLLTTKYVDGLPLARVEYVLGRAGVAVPRQTLARWVIETARALQPIANLMRDALLDSPVLHMDETTVQVLKEKDRSPTSNSYMWVQRGGHAERPVILFDYDPSRSAAVPGRLLEGWSGYLMTDGYEAYSAAIAGRQIVQLGCWAHARRYFVDATKAMPTGRCGHAHRALEMIRSLYRIEREIAGQCVEVRLLQRQKESLPVLASLREWLDKTRPAAPPTSLLGRAMTYLDGQWHKLVRYVERGDLPIDNNACENAIRPFVTGRKAWLFSDTPAGAHASALIYSLVETAKANGCEPYLWLNHVMNNLPKDADANHVESLLPWNWKQSNFSMG
jgi:transposase